MPRADPVGEGKRGTLRPLPCLTLNPIMTRAKLLARKEVIKQNSSIWTWAINTKGA